MLQTNLTECKRSTELHKHRQTDIHCKKKKEKLGYNRRRERSNSGHPLPSPVSIYPTRSQPAAALTRLASGRRALADRTQQRKAIGRRRQGVGRDAPPPSAFRRRRIAKRGTWSLIMIMRCDETEREERGRSSSRWERRQKARNDKRTTDKFKLKEIKDG